MKPTRSRRSLRSRLAVASVAVATVAGLVTTAAPAPRADAEPTVSTAPNPAPARGPQFLLVGAMGTPAITVFRAHGPRLTKVGRVETGQLGSMGVVPHPNGRFVYTSGSVSGTLRGYRMHPNGTMTPLPGSAKNPGPVTGIVYSPDGKYLFATVGMPNTTVVTYRVHDDGSLSRHSATPMRAPISTLSIPVVSPNGKFFYAPSFLGMSMEGFRITDGRLSPIGDVKMLTGLSPALPTMTPDGKFLYIGNEESFDMNIWRVRKDGTLEDRGRTFVGVIPHGSVITPDGKFMYFPLVGGGQVQGRRVLANGGLAPLPGATAAVPTAGRVVLSNDAKWLYVVSVTGAHGTAEVTSFRIMRSGALRRAGGPFDTGLYFHDGATANMVAPGA
ncbi:lactonase family protein [Gordonia sp. FQ]|uniref:lactonase family protein n=1 Tax=Gordonia sp. FQ TaxID=3446634 RepID=UPI003F8496AD